MVRFRNLRGGQQEEEAPEPQGTEEAEAEGQPVEVTEEAPAADEDEEDEQPDLDLDEEAEEGEVAEEVSEEPDVLDQDDDSALKELAARMAVLQSNLESVQGTRSEIEGKLSKMEERMMRLGSLAEAVSSEYNPFIAENSPDEPSWGEDAEANPPEPESEPEPEPAPAAQAEPQAPPEPEPEPEPAPQAEAPEPEPMPRLDEPAPEVPSMSDSLLGSQEQEQPAPDAMTAAEAFSQDRPKVGDKLEEKFMMLEWVDLMLRRVGRANLLDLLEYYEGLGWLDQPTKQRVIRVAVGMDAPDEPDGDQQWRGDLNLHERSLVTIERIHGNEVTAADVESLRMDMQRFFGE